MPVVFLQFFEARGDDDPGGVCLFVEAFEGLDNVGDVVFELFFNFGDFFEVDPAASELLFQFLLFLAGLSLGMQDFCFLVPVDLDAQVVVFFLERDEGLLED